MPASYNVFGSDCSSSVYWKSLRSGINSVRVLRASAGARRSVAPLPLFSVRCCGPGGSVLELAVPVSGECWCRESTAIFLPLFNVFCLGFLFLLQRRAITSPLNSWTPTNMLSSTSACQVKRCVEQGEGELGNACHRTDFTTKKPHCKRYKCSHAYI